MFNFIKKTLVRKKVYFLIWGIIWTLGLIFVLYFNKITSLLFVNHHHHFLLDSLFKYVTFLGDGWFFILVIILIYLFYPLKGLIGFGMFAFTSIVTQTLKRFVFNDMQRPIKIVDNKILHLVDGVEISQYYSFPSGHSTSIFCLSLFLILVFEFHFWVEILFLFCAILGAYSRMYLAQHFLMDVVTGSFIGTFVGLFSYVFICRYLNKNYIFAEKIAKFSLFKQTK